MNVHFPKGWQHQVSARIPARYLIWQCLRCWHDLCDTPFLYAKMEWLRASTIHSPILPFKAGFQGCIGNPEAALFLRHPSLSLSLNRNVVNHHVPGWADPKSFDIFANGCDILQIADRYHWRLARLDLQRTGVDVSSFCGSCSLRPTSIS